MFIAQLLPNVESGNYPLTFQDLLYYSAPNSDVFLSDALFCVLYLVLNQEEHIILLSVTHIIIY